MRAPAARRGEGSLSLARLVAILTPFALLHGAIAFQYIGGLSPCQMCYWQRWPHLTAIVLALAAIAARGRSGLSAMLTALAALAIATSGAIGVFHAGVEYHWWEGLTTCSTGLASAPGQSALDAIIAAPLVRCDVPAWTMFGISMAGYNALLSLGGALLIAVLLLRWSRNR